MSTTLIQENKTSLLVAGALSVLALGYMMYEKNQEQKKKSASLYDRLGGEAAV
jgi:hypothetical protein